MPDFHSIAAYIFRFLHDWTGAISDPRHLLLPRPDDARVITGLEFYLATLTFSFVLQAPFVLGQKGELGEKARLAASSLVGLVSSAVVAMTWHVAFRMFGGGATFAGSFLAYVYAGAPYIPLISLASILIFAGLPSDLQHYALNPATAESAMKRGMNDPRTRKGLVGVGSLSLLLLVIYTIVVQLGNLKAIHQVTGLRFAGCVVLSFILAALVAPLLRALASVFNPPPEAVAGAVPSSSPTEGQDVHRPAVELRSSEADSTPAASPSHT